MFLRHLAFKLLPHIVGIAGLFLLMVQYVDVAPSVATTWQEQADANVGMLSSHFVNRALKADRLMVSPSAPQANEPETTRVPRLNAPGSDPKIGCERPFDEIMKTKSDIVGRCIASRSRMRSTDV